MRINCGHKLLSYNLKFLNFLQFFMGLSTLIYSIYLLNQWNNHSPVIPSAPAPAPALDPDHVVFLGGSLEFGHHIDSFSLGSGRFYFVQLPVPWFIYSLMAIGILLCLMSCIGHIAAEAINGCCLCFHTLLMVLLVLLEAALVAFIVIDHRWEKDLPFDQTGELEKLKSFIEENADICKWVGITLLAVQTLSILISLVLRAVISAPGESDIENDYAASSERIRESLLHSQPNQSSASMNGDGKGAFTDSWTTRMRQKYGLNNESSQYPSLNQNASPSTNS